MYLQYGAVRDFVLETAPPEPASLFLTSVTTFTQWKLGVTAQSNDFGANDTALSF